MLQNKNKGFAMMDALLSFTAFLTLTITLLPIVQQIREERHILTTRSQMVVTLYDELVNNQDPIPLTKQVRVNHTSSLIEFTVENQQLEGCIYWINAKSKEESKCLYVYK